MFSQQIDTYVLDNVVGFPSQMKKGVDKHHLFLDLCRHLSRDSRGLRS